MKTYQVTLTEEQIKTIERWRAAYQARPLPLDECDHAALCEMQADMSATAALRRSVEVKP